jgi:hypothetical protein
VTHGGVVHWVEFSEDSVGAPALVACVGEVLKNIRFVTPSDDSVFEGRLRFARDTEKPPGGPAKR